MNFEENDPERVKTSKIAFVLDPTDIGDNACGLLYKNREICEDLCPSPEEEIPGTSGTEIAGKILEDVFRRATKPHSTKKAKPAPTPKTPLMSLPEIIRNFNIEGDTFGSIVFNENLIISCLRGDYPEFVGALSLHVQKGRGGPLGKRDEFVASKFLVHVSSQFDFKGHNGGSRITSWVDRDLQTLEEKRREFVKIEDILEQQCLYVNSQNDFYYLRHDKKEDTLYSPQKAKNLICEGANLVLMRYLALMRYVGSFEVSTLYIDGALCRNIYICKGPSSGLVNNKKIDVCKIYRTVIEECGLEHRSVTLMSLKGHILKQEWSGCEYILQINPLVDVDIDRPMGMQRVALDVNNDLQLLSLFLDSKSGSKRLIDNYMEDHPEIKNLLADYVQTILQLKPDDIFEYTAKYFLSFTPSLLPHSEYFEGPFNDDAEDDYDFWKYI